MADETPTPTPQGNEAEARTPQGELKDQSPPPESKETTPESGKTNTDPSPEPKGERSFLNREPVKAEEKVEPEKKDGEPEKKSEEPVAGAPEKYEDFKLPDGYAFDPEALKEVTAIFKDANLSQAAAQKLVDYYAKNGMQAAEAPYKLWADTQKSWTDEIGNRFGSKADGMVTDINKGIDAVLTSPKLNAAFREMMDLTGAGSNPDFFEAMSMFVKPFLEGTSIPQGRPSAEGQRAPKTPAAQVDIAGALYPHLIQNRESK